MHFRDGEVMTVPLVDSIDPVTFQYSSIYNMGTRPIGTWEWGLLYKVQYLECAFSTGPELKHKTFFTNVGGSGDGYLYKAQSQRGGGFFISCWILLEEPSLQGRSLGVGSFCPGQCLGPLRVGLGRQLRESVS